MKRFIQNVANNRGDTIVEVLIAIAVVSLVLAGAFTSTRRSANATRTAQEYGEALKLAETQVERIKIAVDNNNSPNVLSAGSFCIDDSGALAGGCTTGVIPYTILTTHTAGSHDFIVRVTWPGLSGSTNVSELDYRAQ